VKGFTEDSDSDDEGGTDGGDEGGNGGTDSVTEGEAAYKKLLCVALADDRRKVGECI
jgi:hypothetical protein